MKEFNCASLKYDKDRQFLIWKIRNTGMPNFCLKGLEEFKELAAWVKDYFSHPDRSLKFIVSGSEHQGIYNMGGDLSFFSECIQTKNRTLLRKYAHACIEAIYSINTAFGLPAITIAMVEGNAYGGGFECALAHDFILANQDAKLGLPENKFNLFPGMGAHSLLYRKLGSNDAETIIRSGNVSQASYFEKLGLVTKVFDTNKAEETLYAFIEKIHQQYNFEFHHIKCKKMVHPLNKQELIKITDVWVEACMHISDFDLRKMKKLNNAQKRKTSANTILQ